MEAYAWVFDASVFIHFLVAGRLRVLVRCRSPLCVPEYVLRVELTGPACRPETQASAEKAVFERHVTTRFLTLEDLARIASLGPRRKAAVGEIACALVAERENGGVLIDDRKAQQWLAERVQVRSWQSTEDVLIDAAHCCEIDEYDLVAIQAALGANKYQCRFDLRNEYLMQRLARHNLNNEG